MRPRRAHDHLRRHHGVDADPNHRNGLRTDNRLANLEWKLVSSNRASRGTSRIASLEAENKALRQRVRELEARLLT